MGSTEPDGEPAPDPPPPSPWRTIALVAGIVIGVYLTLVGIVADLMSVISGLGLAGNLAILSTALGGGWVAWVRRTGRFKDLFDWKDNSTRAWADRVIPSTSIVLALILTAMWYVNLGSRYESPTKLRERNPVTETAKPKPTGGCADPVTESLVHMSHHAFATAPGQDRDIDLNEGGYVQQRFFAATAQVASIAVITSRPGTEGPFDPQRIGQLRLTLYRANDQTNSLDPIPIRGLESDEPPNPAGITVEAGPNHEQTVFRFCPVNLTIGTSYAFRVTNATRGVIISFSLNTKGGRTSIDIVGEIHGEDRQRINYFQVAGYVCSLASC